MIFNKNFKKKISADCKKNIPKFVIFTFLFTNYLKVISYVSLTKNWPLILSGVYRAIALFVLIVIIYLFLIKFKTPYFFIGFYILQALYIVINLSYYFYYHLYLNLYFALPLWGEGLETVVRGGVPWDPRILIVLIDFPFFILVLYFYKNLSKLRANLSYFNKLLFILWLILVGQIMFIEIYHGSVIIKNCSQFWDQSFMVERFGTLANNFVSLTTSNAQEQVIESFDYGEKIIKEESQTIEKNIVFIQVESLDANMLGYKYNYNYVMPFLTKLSKENVYFPYTFSYHRMGGTSDAEFVILNNTLSFTQFPISELRAYNYPNSIVKVLNNQNYQTAAFHGNSGNFFNRDITFQKYGFANFYDIDDMGLEAVGWGAPDEKVFNFAVDKLTKAQEPFFYYIITMSSHQPFTNVLEYYSNSFFDDIEIKITRDYFLSMNYVDFQLQNFVSYVRGQFPNTYIFVYGDHTPRVNNELYADAAYELNGEYAEFVPLIISTPSGQQLERDQKVASFLDIGLTALEVSGINFEISSRGENLLGESLDKCIPFVKDCYKREYLFKGALDTKR